MANSFYLAVNELNKFGTGYFGSAFSYHFDRVLSKWRDGADQLKFIFCQPNGMGYFGIGYHITSGPCVIAY